jgi:hypothetical protein
MDQFIGTESHRDPWNKGKLVGQKAPLKLKEIWAIRVRLQLSQRTRDLALFELAIDSKLRACDLVKLRVRDVSHGDRLAAQAIVMQQKTHARCSSRSPSKREMRFRLGSATRACARMIFCFRVECIGRHTCPRDSTHESLIRGCAQLVSTRPPMAHIRCGGQKRP